MKILKKIIIVLSIILGVLVLFVGGILGYFTAVEYRPPKISEETVKTSSSINYAKQPLKIMTFNIGYGSLGKAEDFVMDGGKKGRADSKEVVNDYFQGIQDLLKNIPADIYLLQEVDYDSRRSYYLDQVTKNHELFPNYDYVYSYNYKANFVPFPFSFTDYIGKVNSGLQTLSKYKIEESFRHQLPGAFAWPIRTVNLKRAIQPSYIKIEGTDKYLVVVNIHLSAYDDGSMRLKEMAYLKEFIEAEYKKGNYVIVGGDFNQTFFGAKDVFPEYSGTWVPMTMKEDTLSDDFTFAIDVTKPTCRSLHKPYDGGENFPYYLIDGFIVSKNITVISVNTINYGFLYSDHNPVILEISLD
ncbi:MAG: endonuclease/exonuclease/phosphatase family protein [Acholeplasmatales bacterium]